MEEPKKKAGWPKGKPRVNEAPRHSTRKQTEIEYKRRLCLDPGCCKRCCHRLHGKTRCTGKFMNILNGRLRPCRCNGTGNCREPWVHPGRSDKKALRSV